MKLVITGAAGLIGWHAAAHVHAQNCAARFNGQEEPYRLVTLDRAGFADDAGLRLAVSDADAVLHFAGVNRAPDEVMEASNPAIAQRLADVCKAVGAQPHVVYANSTRAADDTAYGRSKRRAGEILSRVGGRYTNLILPHIFGEGARAHYNNVTATFIEAVITGTTPAINPAGRVALLHAGAAAQAALDALAGGITGDIRPPARDMAVAGLFDILHRFHADYQANTYPDLRDDFTVALFNSYRTALYPDGFPRPLGLKTDARGTLFEAVKGGGGGQSFLSTTAPGITRGDHFHLNKVERFVVVQGDAVIRIRKVLSHDLWEYRVSGARPVAVDIPTLHTHSIENLGKDQLLILFWTHDLFNPANPDTYPDKVLR